MRKGMFCPSSMLWLHLRWFSLRPHASAVLLTVSFVPWSSLTEGKTSKLHIWLSLWILSVKHSVYWNDFYTLVAWLHQIVHQLIILERSHLALTCLVMLLMRRSTRKTQPTHCTSKECPSNGWGGELIKHVEFW